MNLGELSQPEIFISLKNIVKDPCHKKKGKACDKWNGRVLEAVKVLKESNISRFGELMNQSHDSLRNDYEVPDRSSTLWSMKEESFPAL